MLPLERPAGVSGGAAADATGCRTVHVLPRFVLLGPNAADPAAAAEALSVAGRAGVRGPCGGGTVGPAAGPAAGAAAGGTAAAAEGAAVVAEGAPAAAEGVEGADGAAAAAEGAGGAAAEELRPSELERLLRAPPPSVLGWMVGAREAAAGVARLGLGLGLGLG